MTSEDDPTLAEVAADVAQAMSLERQEDALGHVYYVDDKAVLETDGGDYGLTDPYWFWRCCVWLHEQEYSLCLRSDPYSHIARKKWTSPSEQIIETVCPLAEAPARLVSAVWRRMQK